MHTRGDFKVSVPASELEELVTETKGIVDLTREAMQATTHGFADRYLSDGTSPPIEVYIRQSNGNYEVEFTHLHENNSRGCMAVLRLERKLGVIDLNPGQTANLPLKMPAKISGWFNYLAQSVTR